MTEKGREKERENETESEKDMKNVGERQIVDRSEDSVLAEEWSGRGSNLVLDRQGGKGRKKGGREGAADRVELLGKGKDGEGEECRTSQWSEG